MASLRVVRGEVMNRVARDPINSTTLCSRISLESSVRARAFWAEAGVFDGEDNRFEDGRVLGIEWAVDEYVLFVLVMPH